MELGWVIAAMMVLGVTVLALMIVLGVEEGTNFR